VRASVPIDAAAAAARRGALIVFPTDTVYGIGTRPDDPAATARLFAAKRRPLDLTLPVLVASVDDALRVAVFDDRASRVAAACWPGALTLVLARADASRDWELGGDGATIGVRVPDHPVARSLLGRTGPLAATSANRSGEAPGRDHDELVATFGEAVAVYLRDGSVGGAASTVIDLTGPEPRVLRRGDVDPEHVIGLATAR
jgi:tRNA threonylcarbamoyl adenosine modification protein (Sua5/YciO/YrdC/YwlC family)